MVPVQQVRAAPGKGLDGDRYFYSQGTFSDSPGPGRDVTLIEIEAIDALKRDLGIEIAPGDARRNLVTRGVPLNHQVGKASSVGEVILRGVRLCGPCMHLERLTREGVKAGLIHRGGLRAEILTVRSIRVGDAIETTDA
jgi:MOSC domain-containing protein YiiM